MNNIKVEEEIVNKSITIAVATGQNANRGLRETVTAHNASRHRVTNEIPEELLFGRQIRRNLPLLESTRVTISDSELRNLDWLRKKQVGDHENRKRRSKETLINIGDEVLVKRTQKSKDLIEK